MCFIIFEWLETLPTVWLPLSLQDVSVCVCEHYEPERLGGGIEAPGVEQIYASVNTNEHVSSDALQTSHFLRVFEAPLEVSGSE